MAVLYNITMNVCKGTHWEDSYPPEVIYVLTSTPPAWFDIVLVGGDWLGAYTMTPDAVGVFTVGVVDIIGNTGTITIHVLDCSEGYAFCPAEATANIAWLNPAGGWSTYIFAGVLTKGVDGGKASTFKGLDGVLRYAERRGAYITRVATTEQVPKSHIDYLRTLRYAIQSFLYNEATTAWDIPILLDADNFDEYDNIQQLFQARIKFRYATELIIQSQ